MLTSFKEFFLNQFTSYFILIVLLFSVWFVVLLENPTIINYVRLNINYLNVQLRKYVLLYNLINLIFTLLLFYLYYLYTNTENVFTFINNILTSPLILIFLVFLLYTYLLLQNYSLIIRIYKNEGNNYLTLYISSFITCIWIYWFYNYISFNNFSDLNIMFNFTFSSKRKSRLLL